MYGAGGIKKSSLLTALPCPVITDICPDPVLPGTLVLRLAAVADVTGEAELLNLRLFLEGTVSKLVPLTVTDVPGVPIVGMKLVIVGAPVEAVTVKTLALVEDPPGAVTPSTPVVAPAGTAVTIWVVVDEVTLAETPLNVTAFWLGVVLKPVPKIVTVVPTGPLSGVNSMIDTTAVLCRVIESRLPTAS